MTPAERKTHDKKNCEFANFCLEHKTIERCLRNGRCHMCNLRHRAILHVKEDLVRENIEFLSHERIKVECGKYAQLLEEAKQENAELQVSQKHECSLKDVAVNANVDLK